MTTTRRSKASPGAWRFCGGVLPRAGKVQPSSAAGRPPPAGISCAYYLRWYREMRQTVSVKDIQVGDIALYNFHGGKDPEHCGLIREVNRWANTRELILVQSIEGNTSVSGSQDNGGMVCEKTRYPSQIVAVCRPKYKPEEVKPVDDISGHWAEREIRRCIQRGIIKGYPDGSFQPDKPVTRAELTVVVDRLINLLIGDDDLK